MLRRPPVALKGNKMTPSSNGENGRDDDGRFAPGWRGGPGCKPGRRTARLRAEMLRCVRPADLREIVAVLVSQAKKGDLAAVREVLNRVLGAPVASDILERLEEIEAALAAKGGQHD